MVYKAFILTVTGMHRPKWERNRDARCPLGHLALSLAEALLQGRPEGWVNQQGRRVCNDYPGHDILARVTLW